ncbi:MAG: arginine--tRNA ligase [Erysipelotrichaceae bacterium]|nr:arginine--tRNA ligase [Erysipelotrichaceae bacterium]
MNNIEKILVGNIEKVLEEKFQIKEEGLVMVEIPKSNANGDYSSNVAMRLSKALKKAPVMIASEIKEELEKVETIEKIEIAGPGFMNFWIKKDELASIINTIISKGSNYGENNVGNGTRILMEYVSANPTGDLHLGHARGAAWGDSICRILNKSGYDCLREYYINDAGVQMINLGKSVYARYAENFGVKVELPEDGYHGPDVIEIGKELANELGDSWLTKEDGRIEFFKEQGRKKELEKIEKDLDLFRVHFDSWISEQGLYDSGRVDEILTRMTEMGLTYEKDGALWFKTTNYGDDKDRVLKKADGTLTYLTPDIANHIYKFERGYTKLVNLWGADHHGYVPRMKAAMQAFGYAKDDLEVDIIQMVRLVEDGKEVKMSKRSGNAITIRELCEETSVDAVRYFFVSRAVDTHLDFDIGLARKKTSENPVYYAQYAHARICSILRQAPQFEMCDKYDLLVSEKEVDLLKCLSDFTGVVGDAAITRAPNKICNYIQKLAGYFHGFYAAHKIIDSTNEALTIQRLNLLNATKITLANALDLIGVVAPEKM